MRDRDKILGVALIVLGALFLLGRVTDVGQFAWPLFVIIPGVILLGSAFLGRGESAGLAVPGSIVTTIGLILLILNGTGRWEAWSYCWALIVAGVGAGTFIHGALTSDQSRERDGLRTVYIGLTLFAVFGVFFEFIIFGGLGGSMRWLVPLLLIGAGVYLLFFRDPQTPLPWMTRSAAAPEAPEQPAHADTPVRPTGPGSTVPSGVTPAGAPPPPAPPAPPDVPTVSDEPHPADPTPSDEPLGGPAVDGGEYPDENERG